MPEKKTDAKEVIIKKGIEVKITSVSTNTPIPPTSQPKKKASK
jgi:hypothetical protein